MTIPMLRDVPVAVTGGAGFIGSHLVDALLERGARVTVLDNLATGRVENLAHLLAPAEREALAAAPLPTVVASSVAPVTVVLGDIRNAGDCRLAMGLEPLDGRAGLGGRGALVTSAMTGRTDPDADPTEPAAPVPTDGVSGAGTAEAPGGWGKASPVSRLPSPVYVFHQAALGSVPRSMADPATSIAVNVAGTANVFAAARDAGVRRLVYASSSSVYGDSDTLPKREGEEGMPLSPYALSKVMNEELAQLFAACYAMELVGLRYFNIYGPRQDPAGAYAAVIPRFFAASLAGEPPLIHGDGEQSRDFTFVADAVAANLHAAGASAEACGRAYNVAPGSRTTVNELARLVRAAAGGGPEPIHGEPRPGDVRHSMADATRARDALGFAAEVGLGEGLERAAEYYRSLAVG